MFSYDEKKNVLAISKIPRKKRSTVYEVSDAYLSYKKYAEYGLLQDIREILIPKLNEAVGGTEDLPVIWVEPSYCTMRYDTTSTYQGYEYNTAFIKLSSRKVPKGGKPFAIFKLPYMDKYGLINREGKSYILKNELVQNDDVTFDASSKSLKVITKKGCNIQLKNSTSGANVKYHNTNYSAVKVMIALAVKEGLDPHKIVKLLKDMFITSRYSKEDLEYEIIYGTAECKDILKAYESDAYDLSNARARLNSLLSIDRASGYKLSRAVKLSNGEEIEAETIITSSVLQKLKRNKINEIYVRDVPNILGYYLAENVYVPFFRKGTEMLPQLQEILPDYDGMYLDRNLEVEKAVVFEEGLPIEPRLLNLLAYNGATEVKIKENEKSNKIKVLSFEREIIGNRHFRKKDIGEGSSSEYVYINENGEMEPPKQFICAYDFAAMISLFSRLIKGEDLDYVSNIDLGLRKKVNQANEAFHKAFELAVPEFVNLVKRKFSNILENSSQDLYKPDEMESIFFVLAEKWWRKLGSENMRVIDLPDYTNPVAFYSSLSKIITNVKDAHAVKDDMRNLSMGHYGRLCPYETPSSKKLGLVNNKAIGCKIRDGIMYTSYYVVKHIGNDSYITDEVVWLTVEEEEQYNIGCITDLKVDANKKILNKGQVLARIPTVTGLEKVTIGRIDVSMLNLVNTDPQQVDSYATSTIPFQGGDDAVRVSFEVGMCKQANGQLNAEVPIVMTSANEDIVRISPYFMVQAEYDGEIVDVVQGSVTVYYYELNDTRTYKFKSTEFTTESVIIRSVEVEEGDEVKAGDILVSSNFTREGYLAMGVNALIAYIPKGVNYEDGVYMSKSMQHKMTSYVANKEVVDIPKNHENSCIMPFNKFKYVEPGSRIFNMRYYTKNGYFNKSVIANKLHGFLVCVDKNVDKSSAKDVSATARSVSFNYEESGDKLANRHGNKGVTPPLQSASSMPRLLNGEPLDICYNPAGVSSRMNIGQILECNLGLAGLVLGTRFISDSFNGASREDIKYLLSYAWHMANDDDTDYVASKFEKLPSEFKQSCAKRIDWIRTWRGCFNEDGTAQLYNPTTGKMFEYPVVVGINYVYKLVHESAKKLHARGGLCTEPYIEKTDAPPKGSANKGGQRYGNMEMYAFSAYGASHLQKELLNERGDNAVARNNFTVDALHKGDAYKLPEDTAIRRSTEYFLYAMEALGVSCRFDDGELSNPTIEENTRRKVYNATALILASNVGTDFKEEKDPFRKLEEEVGTIKF